MTKLLIHNCMVLHIAKDKPEITLLRDQDVLINGKTIESVQPAGQVDPSHFDQVIDANGMLCMPGLINTHAHVPMVIFRGLAEDVSIDRWFNDFMWPLESNLHAEDVYWGMLLGSAEMIRGGVTTVADHYFHLDHGARAIEKAGNRALLGWAMFGSQGQEAIERAIHFTRDYEGSADGRITTIFAPHAPYTCDDDFLKASAREAAKLGVGIHIHAAETMDQTRASLEKRGLTPVQVLEQTGILDAGAIIAHACGATPDDVELLAHHNARVAYAIKTQLKLSMGHTPLKDLRSAGVAVGLATDGAVSNNTLDCWEALRLMAMIQKMHGEPEDMPIPEALYIATRESAKVLGMQDQIGAVEAGYLADVILVDLSGMHHQPLHSVTANLVYSMMASDVHTVIINGEVVMRARELLTIDTAEVVAQVNKGMARLAQRQPDKRIQVYNP